VYVSFDSERVLSRNVLIARAGKRVSVKLAPTSGMTTHHPRLSTSLPLTSDKFTPESLGPNPARARAVPVILSAMAHEQTTCEDIHFDDQIHSRVVVFDTSDGRVLGAFWIDEPTVYEGNACAGEESEFPICRSSRVEEVKTGLRSIPVMAPVMRVSSY
jgi:hypothetical protein